MGSSKITMPYEKGIVKEFRKRYNIPVGSLACQEKEVSKIMASQKLIKGSLHDEDGTWIIRARVLDPATGKTRQRSKSTGLKVKDKTKRRAEQVMREIVEAWEQEAKQEHITEPPKKDIRFGEYINGWLNSKDLSVRANTAKSYRDYAKVHIIPALGNYLVTDISWRILQEFCDRMLADHSKSTVKKVIRGALDDAVRDDAIQANPEGLVKWPKAERVQKARALTPDEIARLLDAAERAGEPMRAAIILALFYGLRRSEACGLRWTDIDFSKNTMHIQHTVVQNGTVLLDDDHTKTHGSNRTLALIEQTIPYLKQLRTEQIKSGHPVDKVVAWPDGRAMRPDGVTRMFSTLLKNSGIDKARYHDLRHPNVKPKTQIFSSFPIFFKVAFYYPA